MVDCNNLLAFAHQTDDSGAYLALPRQREQIIISSFLNFFLAWEMFVESSFLDYMMGESSIHGINPVCLVTPLNRQHALNMLIGTHRYFDFGNHHVVLTMARLFFQSGGPFGTYLPSVTQRRIDMRVMRNATAHISATTQTKLDLLAQRILGPSAIIPCKLYDFLLMQPTRVTGDTIFAQYQREIDVAAELIANG